MRIIERAPNRSKHETLDIMIQSGKRAANFRPSRENPAPLCGLGDLNGSTPVAGNRDGHGSEPEAWHGGLGPPGVKEGGLPGKKSGSSPPGSRTFLYRWAGNELTCSSEDRDVYPFGILTRAKNSRRGFLRVNVRSRAPWPFFPYPHDCSSRMLPSGSQT